MNSKNEEPSTDNNDLRRDALAVLLSHIQAHERYHTQKENMTWLATTAYVGAVALLIGRDPFWQRWPIQWFGAWFALILITGIAVILFIQWQFENRNKATTFFTCCNDVAAQWLTSNITKAELLPVPLLELSGMLVPDTVEKRFRKISNGKFSWPQRLTLTVVVLWTIGGGIYIMLKYQGICGS
jgi:hypothetical protein